MSGDDTGAFLFIMFLCVVCLLGGSFFGRFWGEKNVERQAIERGVAIYHPQTAVFTWTVTNNLPVVAEKP